MNARLAGPHPLFLESCLLVATWFSLTGWILSLLGCLNRAGYLASVFLGATAFAMWLRMQSGDHCWSVWRAWRRRIRQPFPALYAAIFTLAALGGLLYPPNNYDALTYRLPQLLHWLDAGRWHWIATSNDVLNIAGPGYTWLMGPFLTLTHSDRGFFLPNIVAFALLPGLFFTSARGCGVRRRVAWFWMWILPSGYCYAMQAGGIANDLLPAAYLLAALALAFRARKVGSVRAAWFSILAAALATGVKVVVLPLALAWLIAIAPVWPILLRRPFVLALITLISLSVSFLPTAILNTRHTGDWSGDPENTLHLRLDHPIAGIAINTVQIVVENLEPPICPFSASANALFAKFEAGPIGEKIRAKFPRFDLRWFELAAEDGSGIGLGIFVLIGLSLVVSTIRRFPHASNSADPIGLLVCNVALLAAIVYAAKMGSEAGARLFAAYYPWLLMAFLRLDSNEWLTRHHQWRKFAWLCAASTVPVLILTPARPLWPTRQLVAKLAQHYPGSAFLRRSQLVYDVLSTRHDYFAPLKKYIPTGVRTVGFVPTGNDLEGSLWRPFGSRRVIEILTPSRADSAVQQLKGSVVICSSRGLSEHFGMTLDTFTAAIGGHVIGQEMLTLKAVVGPEPWFVIAVDAPSRNYH